MTYASGMESTNAIGTYTLADATLLNQIKNQIRGVTKAVDTLPMKVYPDTIEAKQVKHEISILLSELAVRGLLPVEVHISQEPTLASR